MALGDDGCGEGLDGIDHPIELWLPDPPANRQASDLLGEAIELWEECEEACNARVRVVALVDGGSDDASLLHVLEEARALPADDADSIEPPA